MEVETINTEKINAEQDSSNSSDNDEQETEAVIPNKKRKKMVQRSRREDNGAVEASLFGNKEQFYKNLERRENDVIEIKQEITEAAWEDSDDDDKLAITQQKKFARTLGKPSWAEGKIKAPEDSDDEVITKHVGLLAGRSKVRTLNKDVLSFKKLKSMNRATQNEGQINAVLFHKHSTVGIVAGSKGIVSIFAIDGNENKKIHSIKYERFKLTDCKLHSDGSELISGGIHNYYHTYDLLTGVRRQRKLPNGIRNLRSFEVSPCEKYMAVIGEYGDVFILNCKTNEHIASFKQEYQSTSVCFTSDSGKILSHSDNSEVTVFDLRSQRITHRFIDEGCVNGSTLAISSNDKYIATGSRQGVVNIYNNEDIMKSKYPVAVKAFQNLTTSITTMKFNPTSEILAFGSDVLNNAVKMIHMPSLTVFNNFPKLEDDLGKATTFGYSPAGGYFAMGTIRQQVPLFRDRKSVV